MRRTSTAGILGLGLLGLLFAGVPASAGTIYEIDYATYDVRVMDTKGITTEAREFGFNSGPNILVARRGDAFVEIPFRMIRSLEVGEYIPPKGYSTCTVVARSGKTFQVELERLEGQRFLSGHTDVGTFRIRLGQMRRLELLGLSHAEGLR